MRMVDFSNWRKHARSLLLVFAAGVFLVQAGDEPANAGQSAISREQSSQDAQDKQAIRRPDWVLQSRPETIAWGWFPLDYPAALRIQSGQTVRINTLTGSGATGTATPAEFFAPFGVQPAEILRDVFDFWTRRAGAGGSPPEPREGRSGHLLTGPIYIDDAEPGDMLEVRILDVKTRVPYGINNTSPNGGVFGLNYPGRRPEDPDPALPDIPAAGTIPGVRQHLYRTTTVRGRDVALFSESIHVPLGPFMGVMAVAPLDPIVGQPGVTVPGVQASGPPGRFGGNMDLKQLTAGTTLYLPIFRPGAQFYTGDPHSAQGDGEVSGTAIEHSLTGVFRFIRPQGQDDRMATRRERRLLHPDGHRPRSQPRDADRHDGSREVSRGRKGADPGQGAVAGQHRCRFSGGGSRRRHAGRHRKHPKELVPQEAVAG